MGTYAVVKLGHDTKRKEEVAIKYYDRMKLSDPIKKRNFEAEVENLKLLDNENIIKLYDVLEGRKQIALVMEYVGDKSLFDYLLAAEKGKITEAETKTIFVRLFRALAYTHSNLIVHRDIKLQNVIIGDKGQVKLIDFGFSLKVPNKAHKLGVFCGTPSYMSPELVKRIPYDGFAADVWALGVCLFRSVTGQFPFKGINESDLYNKIRAATLVYPKSFSPELKDLLTGLFKPNPDERLTAAQGLQHNFFHDVSIPEDSTLSVD